MGWGLAGLAHEPGMHHTCLLLAAWELPVTRVAGHLTPACTWALHPAVDVSQAGCQPGRGVCWCCCCRYWVSGQTEELSLDQKRELWCCVRLRGLADSWGQYLEQVPGSLAWYADGAAGPGKPRASLVGKGAAVLNMLKHGPSVALYCFGQALRKGHVHSWQ